MRKDAFWITTFRLRRYKRALMVGFSGALLSALCYGAGIGMLLPVFILFFDARRLEEGGHPLQEMIDRSLGSHEGWRGDFGSWLSTQVPDSLLTCFILIMAVIAGLTIVGSVGRFVHQSMIIGVTLREAALWRDQLFERMIHAPMNLFWTQAASDHASRILNDTNILVQGHQAILGKAVAEILKGMAALTMAFIFDWRLTLLALFAAPLISIMMRKFGKVIRKASKKTLVERANLFKTLTQVLVALPLVKTYDAEGYERRHFRRQSRRLLMEQMRMRTVKALSSPVIETLALFGVMIAGVVAAWMVFNQKTDPQNILLVLFALAAAGSSLKPLTSLHVQIKESDAAAQRILEADAIPCEPIAVADRQKMTDLPDHRASIVFEQVRFSYGQNEQLALDEINLSIPHGSHIAIVGPNGSGKTTLLSLIPRLLDPTQGRVLIDGHDVREVNLRTLRRQIAAVSQQNVLFEGTIAENIAYGQSWVAMERIEQVARSAYVDEFVRELPDGYHTRLGEGGTGLSGGQRQRICIARAVLRDPRIMILDEATSQIDADSEYKIHEALRTFRAGRTVLTIAHRLSTVIDADCILVMFEGRIIDRGTHAQLLERCDLYRVLTRTQLQSDPS